MYADAFGIRRFWAFSDVARAHGFACHNLAYLTKWKESIGGGDSWLSGAKQSEWSYAQPSEFEETAASAESNFEREPGVR